MAAGSVAAGGLYMQSEFSQLKKRKLQELGVAFPLDNSPATQGEMAVTSDSLAEAKPQRRTRQDILRSSVNLRSKLRRVRSVRSDQPAGYSPSHTVSDRRNPENDLDVRRRRSLWTSSIAGSMRERESAMSTTAMRTIVETEGSGEEKLLHTPPSQTSLDKDVKMINVSGTVYLVDFGMFKAYPDTLLGDNARLESFYVPERNEYFFERQKHIFAAVLRFYTHDEELVCPPCIPKAVFESEIQFYGLEKYCQQTTIAPIKTLKDYRARNRREEILLHLEFPGYSKLATAYALFDLLMIIISTVILVMESVPELTDNKTFSKACELIEIYVNIYFTIQAIVLISVYPSKKLYFSSVTNWIDLISILPFYCKLIAKEYLNAAGGFRVLRLIRLLRILKLFRHSPGSQTMIHFLINSIPEIILLLLMWSIGVLMFGPIIYFVEKPSDAAVEKNFTSAFSGMWFCVVTIGTVGYGDIVPSTDLGKFLAAVYAILNLTIMTIPISIIITKFNKSIKKVS